MQFVYVNGRPIRDKLFTGAIRAAYMDFLAHDRHPSLRSIFIAIRELLISMFILLKRR